MNYIILQFFSRDGRKTIWKRKQKSSLHADSSVRGRKKGDTMRILFIGDIVGKGGRQAVKTTVRELMRENRCDFCIANGENMAGGGGFTKSCLAELDESGIDVFTSNPALFAILYSMTSRFPIVILPADPKVVLS